MAFKGYALKARGIFAYAKMPNVLIAAYVHPGRCPGLGATIGLSARPKDFPCGAFGGRFAKRPYFLAITKGQLFYPFQGRAAQN